MIVSQSRSKGVKERAIRKEKLRVERLAELEKFEVDGSLQMLGEMKSDVWENYIAGVELQYNQRKKAEADAEKARIEAEKAEELRRLEYEKEQAAIRKENERLKKEAEAKEAAHRKAEQARQAKEVKERAIREEKERKEREAHEAELREEREAKAKIEAELRAKAEAERKAKEAEQARIEAELSKGDAAKVQDLIKDMEGLKTKYKFKSKKNQAIYEQVGQLLDKVINHIQK